MYWSAIAHLWGVVAHARDGCFWVSLGRFFRPREQGTDVLYGSEQSSERVGGCVYAEYRHTGRLDLQAYLHVQWLRFQHVSAYSLR